MAFCFVFLATDTKPSNNKLAVHSYYDNWIQRFNVHSSPKHRIVYGDKVFNDVVGRSPYYLNLPSIHAIMFAQRLDSGQRIVVLYDNGEITNFEDPYGSFLKEIGGPDQISCNASNRGIELKYESNGVRVTYWFDIPTRQIVKKYD